MMSDVMSIFDISTCGVVNLGILIWFSNFMFILIFVGVIFFNYGSRFFMYMWILFKLVFVMVKSSKLGVLGGGSLMLKSLFMMLLLSNIAGLVPFVSSSSSHLVFSLSFGFSFWFGLVLSSLFFGKLYTSMSKLVFAGLPVGGGMILCWLEKLSIFFRWFTLSLRLVANMTVGQILSGSVSGIMLNYYFGMGSIFTFFMVLIIGVGLLLVELAVGFIQAYLFCLLLSVYSDDHSI